MPFRGSLFIVTPLKEFGNFFMHTYTNNAQVF
jgi:hypothetical protein